MHMVVYPGLPTARSVSKDKAFSIADLLPRASAQEEAIRIDRAALEAKSSDYGTLDGTLQRKSLVYPYTWHSSTENTVKTAKHWQHDAVALRRYACYSAQHHRIPCNEW